jgi:hypothetical protein
VGGELHKKGDSKVKVKAKAKVKAKVKAEARRSDENNVLLF